MSDTHTCRRCLKWYVSDAALGLCWNCQQAIWDVQKENEDIKAQIKAVRKDIDERLDTLFELLERKV